EAASWRARRTSRVLSARPIAMSSASSQLFWKSPDAEGTLRAALAKASTRIQELPSQQWAPNTATMAVSATIRRQVVGLGGRAFPDVVAELLIAVEDELAQRG